MNFYKVWIMVGPREEWTTGMNSNIELGYLLKKRSRNSLMTCMLMIKSQTKKKENNQKKTATQAWQKWQIMDINTGSTYIQALNISLPRIWSWWPSSFCSEMDKFLVWLSFFLRSGLVFRRLWCCWSLLGGSWILFCRFWRSRCSGQWLEVVRGKTPRTFVTEEGLNNRNLKGLNLTWFCFWGL